MTQAADAKRLGWGLGAGLCAIYLSQGITHGVGLTLVSWQAARGAPLQTQADLVAWGALPWVLKFIWSLVWDRFLRAGETSGRTRVLALAGLQLAVGGCLAGFGALGASPWLPALFFCMNLLGSLQDVGTDALVVDAVPERRRGQMNAAMLAARAVGVGVLGTLVFARAVKGLGADATLIRYGLGLLLLAALVASMGRAPGRPASSTGWPPLAALWSTPGRRLALALALLAQAGDALSSAITSDFMFKRAGWTLEAYFEQLVPLAVGMEVLGYVLAGVLVARIGARHSTLSGALALAIIWGGLAFVEPLWTSHAFLLGYAVCESLARAILYVGVYTLLMAHTEPERRATHFMIYMTLMNLPRVVEAAVVPHIFEAIGYAGVYLCCGALSLVLVALITAWRDADRPEATASA